MMFQRRMATLLEFAVDLGRAPTRIFLRQAVDQRTDFGSRFRSSTTLSGSPPPEETESFPVPVLAAPSGKILLKENADSLVSRDVARGIEPAVIFPLGKCKLREFRHGKKQVRAATSGAAGSCR
jgi:hypothetical protein